MKAKQSGQDIGDYENVLKEYEQNAKANAYLMTGAIEFVNNSYSSKFAGSEALGSVLSVVRNFGLDLLDTSELAKYNLMSYASGTVTHPSRYEWI